MPNSPPPHWRHNSLPQDTNGWRQYVAATLEHLLVRLHYMEGSLDELKSKSRASDAPITKEPSSKDTWSERKETAKEIGTALRWLAVIVLLVLLGMKKLELSQLPALGRLLGGGA